MARKVRAMRAAQMSLVLTVWVLGGCASGSDPGRDESEAGAGAGTAGMGPAGAGASAGTGGRAGSGGAVGTSGSGAIAGTTGSAGSMGPIGGTGPTAGTTAGAGGAAGADLAGAGALPPGDGSFFPLVTGNSWTFRVTDAGVVSMKTQTIGALEVVGGTGPNKDAMAYRATTTKDDGGDMTVSWQAEVDGKIVRYREQAFATDATDLELEEHWDPYKLRVDASEEHLMAGATWTETYMETKLPVGMAPSTATANDAWRVISVSESVTVPAGTFDALVIEKTSGSPKRYWFVRGVGKVKETGTQTEELASYEVME
jgi:hypothetical protein